MTPGRVAELADEKVTVARLVNDIKNPTEELVEQVSYLDTMS